MRQVFTEPVEPELPVLPVELALPVLELVLELPVEPLVLVEVVEAVDVPDELVPLEAVDALELPEVLELLEAVELEADVDVLEALLELVEVEFEVDDEPVAELEADEAAGWLNLCPGSRTSSHPAVTSSSSAQANLIFTESSTPRAGQPVALASRTCRPPRSLRPSHPGLGRR